MKNLKVFTNYVFQFYGPNGLYAHYFQNRVTKAKILAATKALIASGADFQGDSFDREKVREILLTMDKNARGLAVL